MIAAKKTDLMVKKQQFLVKRTNYSLFGRCFSATGRTGGKQILSLGKGCQTKGVVIHELLHALGMLHEHCRFDRNQFIRINANNIKPSKNSLSLLTLAFRGCQKLIRQFMSFPNS